MIIRSLIIIVFLVTLFLLNINNFSTIDATLNNTLQQQNSTDISMQNSADLQSRITSLPDSNTTDTEKSFTTEIIDNEKEYVDDISLDEVGEVQAEGDLIDDITNDEAGQVQYYEKMRGTPYLKSPFKSCIINPTSKAFSDQASYEIRGQAQARDSGNYSINRYITLDLNYIDNKLTGYVSTGDFSAMINANEITTTCKNSKDLSTFSTPSSIIIPRQSHIINPPLNSCPSDSDIRYYISGTFNRIKDNDIIKIDNPNEMYFNAYFSSYFKEGTHAADLSIGPLYDSFKVENIFTECRYRQ
jgi:hypothetical protein